MTELTQLEQALEATSVGKWKAYPAYKNSGIEWLGEIPEHWEVKRTDGCLKENRNLIDQNKLHKISVFHYSIPAIEETGDGRMENGSEIDSNKLVIKGGELLISKLNPRKSRVLIAESHQELTICSPEFVVLRPYNCDVRFAFFLFSSERVRQYLSAQVESATRSHQRVAASAIAKMWLCMPSRLEQFVISNFLDRESSKINILIDKKERLIGLLQEKRAALISDVVTKGLDPNVKMKDSGVEWLGEIPVHWEVKRLKFVVKSMVAGPFGSSLTKDLYTAEGFRVYGQEQVIPADFSIGDYYIPEDMYLRMQRYAVNTGDVLISCVGTFGKVAVVPANAEPGIINPRLVKLIPKKDEIIPVYLGMLLKSRIAFEQMKQSSHGGTMDIINIGLLSEIILPLPPFEEQMRIMTYLDSATASIDALISKIGEAIEKLKEYSAALISAAVTGKIDVRGEVASVGDVDYGD